MISGHFYHPLGNGQEHEFRPCVCAGIAVGKYRLPERRFRFLLDTGADHTSLSLRDSYCILGDGYFWQFQKQQPSELVTMANGGVALFHRIEIALTLTHDNGHRDESFIQAQIPAIQVSQSEELRKAIEATSGSPNILGREVLCRYKLVVDHLRRIVTLDAPIRERDSPLVV